VLSEIETIEMVHSLQGTAQTIAVMGDMGHILPSPDGSRIAEVGGDPSGMLHLGVYILLGEEHPCGPGAPEGCDLVLRTQRAARFRVTSRAAWSPNGRFLAIVYCRDGCPYEEAGPADVRLIDVQTGALSASVWSGADTLGGIEWRP
jgi:hypothetical protein